MHTNRWWPGFVALSAIWGSSFALIKVAVEAGVPPAWVALWRCCFGACALLAACAVRRAPLPRDPVTWAHAAVVAALLNAVPFALLAHGELLVSSVLAGALNATTPLATLVFAVLLVPSERLSKRRVFGLLVGLGGVLVLLGVGPGQTAGQGAGEGALACLAATLCYGAGFAYTRRFFSGRGGSAVALSAAQIGTATVELALVTPWLAGPPSWPGATAAVALTLLGAVGTGYAYILNLRVIRAAGAAVAATVTYLTPVWSTALGALLLAEPVGWHTVAGAALVIAGILVATRRLPGAGTSAAPGRRPRGGRSGDGDLGAVQARPRRR
ncbi:DMT family transporter [Pseudonocardia acaciae]|uniref:DMT family transporter n=1 Tax=Pseudonocardia acaciae TaxID=551276 RepID=UPI0007E8D288|nr:DMT family transporter [Pseudonocardia acaciae]